MEDDFKPRLGGGSEGRAPTLDHIYSDKKRIILPKENDFISARQSHVYRVRQHKRSDLEWSNTPLSFNYLPHSKAEDREEEKDCEGNGSEQAAYPAKFNISARLFLAEQSRLKIQ